MHIDLKPLAQQTIVITGASSGIGLTTAQEAAKRGANVVLVARSADTLREEVQKLKARGLKADYVVADVGERENIRKVIDTVVERHGGFDTWVNNAGVGIYASLEETSDEDHHKIFQTNYWGLVYGTLEALKHLKPKGGAIINIGSISSDMPAPILSAYTASKHAVKGFNDSLRLELMHEGAPVALTLIKPSGIHTPFGDHAVNYMDHASKVPPPVYHPRVVARAILHAAEHKTREILVGEAGAAQVGLAKFFPRLADKLFSRAFYLTAIDWDREAKHEQALHEPGGGGKRLGDQDSIPIRVSPYTEAQKHPVPVVLLGALATAGALLFILGGQQRQPKRRSWKRLAAHR